MKSIAVVADVLLNSTIEEREQRDERENVVEEQVRGKRHVEKENMIFIVVDLGLIFLGICSHRSS